jgi:hypothetical protein
MINSSFFFLFFLVYHFQEEANATACENGKNLACTILPRTVDEYLKLKMSELKGIAIFLELSPIPKSKNELALQITEHFNVPGNVAAVELLGAGLQVNQGAGDRDGDDADEDSEDEIHPDVDVVADKEEGGGDEAVPNDDTPLEEEEEDDDQDDGDEEPHPSPACFFCEKTSDDLRPCDFAPQVGETGFDNEAGCSIVYCNSTGCIKKYGAHRNRRCNYRNRTVSMPLVKPATPTSPTTRNNPAKGLGFFCRNKKIFFKLFFPPPPPPPNQPTNHLPTHPPTNVHPLPQLPPSPHTHTHTFTRTPHTSFKNRPHHSRDLVYAADVVLLFLSGGAH